MTKPVASDRVAESILIALNCPRALTIVILLRYKEYAQITSLDIIPEDYSCASSFKDAYLATKLLSKNKFLKTNIDLKAVAITGFFDAEESCKKTNQRLRSNEGFKNPSFAYIHNECIRQIDRILGDFSSDEIFDLSNWGPGVTLGIKRDTSGVNKFRCEGGITETARDFVSELFPLAYPHWRPEMTVNVGNKIVTVPKNAKTDRTIAVEPGLNLWFQKGLGTMIRRRLLRAGVNLNSQDRNQKLARLASITGDLATVDFSSASDTISKQLIRDILPHRWWLLLSIFRSPVGQFEGTQIRYEKFSSMGNGFTFELESLVFHCLALAVCKYLDVSPENVSTFGDDVIIPSVAFDLYTEIAAIYGFVVNKQKSYKSGYFRESCGEHFYNGVNCKPLFIKEEIINEIEIYKLANGIRRLAHRYYRQFDFNMCDRRFRSSWLLCYQSIKHPCLISDNFGDGGFIVNFDEACPSRAKHGIEGYFTKALVATPYGRYNYDHGLYLQRLWVRSEMEFGNESHQRGRVSLSRKRMLIPQWYNLGPWI